MVLILVLRLGSKVQVEIRRSGPALGLKFFSSKKGSPYSTAEHRVPELIPVLGSQPAGDVSHKPAITVRQACSYPRNSAATNFTAW